MLGFATLGLAGGWVRGSNIVAAGYFQQQQQQQQQVKDVCDR
jgi:hypothetical protein